MQLSRDFVQQSRRAYHQQVKTRLHSYSVRVITRRREAPGQNAGAARDQTAFVTSSFMGVQQNLQLVQPHDA